MKKSLSLWQFAGFAVTSFSGTLLHFLYDWSGGSLLIAPFSGVNESTWEHMKLLFFPLFVFALVERSFFRAHENFWCIKLSGIATGLALIPLLFYTYNGVIGKSPDWINISIFFVSAAAAYLLETRLFKKDRFRYSSSRLAFAVICLIGAAFVIFTFATPKLAIFKDPLTNTYGL